MSEVIVSKKINSPANTAWEILSSFRGIEKFSPIERSETNGEGEGATRTCFLPDGAAIHEVLSKVDNSQKEFEYKITKGPFPVTDYISTVKVTDIDADNCEIKWGCNFQTSSEAEKEMKDLFAGFYNVIIESLETMINHQN